MQGVSFGCNNPFVVGEEGAEGRDTVQRFIVVGRDYVD
jgi:hypothetical protein